MIGCVDLFCGLGGLTHGLARGGVAVVAGVDLDPHCRFPYERNNAAQFVQADIKRLKGDTLNALLKGHRRTLVAGCAPCQPFSTYSRKDRKLRTDNKWDLVLEFGRIVQEMSPDFITMENVPQLADHAVFDTLRRSLKKYEVWWKIIDCARFGVPQTRKRLVLIGSRWGRVGLDNPTLIDGHRLATTVRTAIGHLPEIRAGECHPKDRLHAACSLSPLNLKRIRVSKPGGTWRDWSDELIAKCHRKDTGKTYPSIYGRMEWDALAPTITTQSFGYGNGRFGHPEQHRAISLREAAILQTFPDDYGFLPGSEKPKFSVLGRLIGNAVPVRLGEVIAEALTAHSAKHSA